MLSSCMEKWKLEEAYSFTSQCTNCYIITNVAETTPLILLHFCFCIYSVTFHESQDSRKHFIQQWANKSMPSDGMDCKLLRHSCKRCYDWSYNIGCLHTHLCSITRAMMSFRYVYYVGIVNILFLITMLFCSSFFKNLKSKTWIKTMCFSNRMQFYIKPPEVWKFQPFLNRPGFLNR